MKQIINKITSKFKNIDYEKTKQNLDKSTSLLKSVLSLFVVIWGIITFFKKK
jgi:hypothetical protein